MLARQIVRKIEFCVPARCFTRNDITREINKPDKIPVQRSTEAGKQNESILGTRMHRVTNFDKKILVWVKRYPSVADVPQDVTVDCILSARSKARIKTCNYMIIVSIIGFIGSALLGKRQAAKGQTLLKQREDWYKENVIGQNDK